MKKVLLLAVALAAVVVTGCASIDGGGGIIHHHPAAIKGDYSGKDFSGSFAMIPDDCNIPGVPASACAKARPRWSQIEVDQVLHIDANCQVWLFKQLPPWAIKILSEGGWGALVTAVGETGFAAAFPGAKLVRYFLAGLGYSLPSWANNGRIETEQSQYSSAGYCATIKIRRAQKRYHILRGWDAIPVVGGHTTLPVPTDSVNSPQLPYVRGGTLPPPPQ